MRSYENKGDGDQINIEAVGSVGQIISGLKAEKRHPELEKLLAAVERDTRCKRLVVSIATSYGKCRFN
jgi:hypothetical protein